MSKTIPLFNNKNFEEESSDDSISGMDKPEQPLFYMFPESSDEDKESNEDEKIQENENRNEIKKKEKNYFFNINKKSISRKTMLSKLDLLAKYHKNSETKLLQSKIGWHTIYELFFEKYFFLDKVERENGIYINLKEVEIRIRKELGKIGKKQYDNKSQESLFTLFDKVQYNPPVSAWYSHNFLSDNSNKLISPKEKNSYFCKLINEFTNYESPKDEDIKESNIKNNLNQKDNKTIDNNSNNIIINNNNNRGFMDNMIKKLSNLKEEEEVNADNKNNNLLYNNELGNKKDIIPKGAKKVVNKFLKKYNISNISYVEDEINNIQTNEKAYEVELRNTKLFESKLHDGRKKWNNVNGIDYWYGLPILAKYNNKTGKHIDIPDWCPRLEK